MELVTGMGIGIGVGVGLLAGVVVGWVSALVPAGLGIWWLWREREGNLEEIGELVAWNTHLAISSGIKAVIEGGEGTDPEVDDGSEYTGG